MTRMATKTILFMCGLTTTSLLAACSSAPASSAGSNESTGASASDLYVAPGGLWMHGVVPVCWEPTSSQSSLSNYAALKQNVRDLIFGTWESVSAVKTTGWGDCTPGFTGLHITAQAGRSHADVGVGPSGNAGISLDLLDSRKGTPIHEFGHILGFLHEQNRDDTPDWCTEEAINDDGTVTIGGVAIDPWDEYSIMDYCNPNFSDGKLSASDIRGVQAFYGANWGALVGPSATCLDVPAANTADGTTPTTYNCLFEQNQEWLWDTAFSGPLKGIGGKCLTRHGSGSPTEQTCNGSADQSWSMQNFEIRGVGKWCLDVAGGQTSTPGTAVNFYGCNDQDGQKWTYTAARELRTPGGLCLDIPGGDPSKGLVVWTCNGGPNQKWTIGNGGEIKSSIAGNKCLDVSGLDVANMASQDGASGSVYDCNSQINQKYAFRGAIYAGVPSSTSASCLTLPGGVNAANNTVPFVGGCGGRSLNGISLGDSTQKWNYTRGLGF